MEEIVLFFLSFLIIFIVYELFVVLKAKKNYGNKNDKKMPIEVKYLIKKYNLDIKKEAYFQLLQIIAIVSSFDISLIVTLILLVDGYIFQLLLAIVFAIPIILISYHFVGVFYIRKGMIKNV